jgi:HPr kinase/phosphorylase
MVSSLSARDEFVYLVKHFFEQHGKNLGLDLVAGAPGLTRRIHKAEVQRPGLSLTGYLHDFVPARVLVVGKQEIGFIQGLKPKVRMERLKAILTPATPAVIVARGFKPPKELISLCQGLEIPLFSANSTATNLLSRITFLLLEEFCPSVTLHGTLVEVFGVGVLIQGESSVGILS